MEEIQKVRISVRNLVEFILREGDIDNRRGSFGEKEAMQEGSRVHRRIQKEMGSGYQAEVPLSIDVSWDADAPGFVLTVEGRADGIFTETQGTKTRATAKRNSQKRDTAKRSAVKQNPKNQASYAPCEPELFCVPESAPPADAGQTKISADAGQTEITYIDEIKGIYRDVMSLERPFPVHLAQAKCYAYICGKQQGLSHIGVQMTYCTLESAGYRSKTRTASLQEADDRDGDSREEVSRKDIPENGTHPEELQIRRFRQIYEMGALEDWFMNVAGQYRKWAQLETDWKKVRQDSIRGLEFPYPWRPGQRDVAASVYRTILRRKKLFIQAPTGTGKTLSTVFPAVKAVGEGKADRIFYATAKTITRTVAEESFGILREHGLHMKTVTLTAKEKICFMEETECNPDACPYAKGHYDRVNDAVYELLTEKEELNRPTLEVQAKKWHVCPFEMGLDAALWTDAVICDYNYIFDPRARLKRFFGEGVKGEYLFLIDEAHNLVERGREMFSASLYKEDFLSLRKDFQALASGETAGITESLRRLARSVRRALGRCGKWFAENEDRAGSGTENMENSSPVRSAARRTDIGTFPVMLMNLCGLIETFLEDSPDAELNAKTLELYFQVRRFLDTCDRLNNNYVVYTEHPAGGRFLLRLYCVDVSENLQECLDRGTATIYFSATFLPINYYKSLLGTAHDDYAIYAQPVFDPANRLVLIGTDTSSRYKNRSPQEYRKMAEYVFQVMRAKRGNYMVFFSSYQMMDDVADQFDSICMEAGEPVETVRQMNRMSEEEREAFLEKFEEAHPQGLAGFCVMGGIFGEGIDLREDRLIGAIIAGAGLPQVCTEREILKEFYDERGEDGFFYAYLCPGMNRVLQSAGRVIRTESDRGVILLLDERFTSARYRSMFPVEWERPGFCTVRNVGGKVEEFWKR